MEEIRNYSAKEFVRFIESELSPINDLQLIILKGHILVEYSINCYLEEISLCSKTNFFRENLRFSDKLKVLKHFTPMGGDNGDIIDEIDILNRIRNDIAHRLKYKESQIRQLFARVKKLSPEGILSNVNSSKKEKCIACIAFLGGATFGAYKLHKDLNKF